MTTDEQRAADYCARWWREDEPDESTVDEVHDLLAQFAAVRLEERAAVVAYMRERYLADGTDALTLADAIRRGAHLDAGGRAGS